MRLHAIAIVMALVSVIAACGESSAPDDMSGDSLTGLVTTYSGDPIEGAVVVLQHEMETYDQKSGTSLWWATVQVVLDEPGFAHVWIASFCDNDTVRVLIEGELQAGQHFIQWDGRDGYDRVVSDGVYWAHIEIPDSQSRIPLAYLGVDYSELGDDVIVRPVCVSGPSGEFSIAQECLPLDFSYSSVDLDGEQLSVTSVTRLVKVWAWAQGWLWASTEWIAVSEDEGADITLQLVSERPRTKQVLR